MLGRFFDQFLAKSDGTTLVEHTQHVIIAGANLLKTLPLTQNEREYWDRKLRRCAVLHDLGKIHRAFQQRLAGDKKVDIRHEIISLWFCENFLELANDEFFAIATHHKGVIRPGGMGRLELNDVQSGMQQHLEAERSLMTAETLSAWLASLHEDLRVKTSATHTDISRGTVKMLHYSHQETIVPNSSDRQKLSYMRALMIAADHIGSARMENEIPSYKRIYPLDFQPKSQDGSLLPFRSFQLRLQRVLTDVIVHAPTGSGKTEAALNWVCANQNDNSRLFYLLPYTASINAMVVRLQRHFGRERVTALHSKTLDFFFDQISGEESNLEKGELTSYQQIEKDARTKKSLSAEIFFPVKVATLHQVLKAVLKGKGWELALYDFKNALFIIDEFHTYNALLTGMLLASVKLLRQFFNAKFLFMSATIPDFMLQYVAKEIFDNDISRIVRPDPVEESDREILTRKRHKLICQCGRQLSGAVQEIKAFLAQGMSVLVVVNNVKTAQQLYEHLSLDGIAELLHGGFHKKDRIRIEKSITSEEKSKRPKVLVATQAIEVSLDIDYDVAFIENAPIDALIQRLGRVNRAGLRTIAPVFLFEDIIGRTPFYDKNVLNDTWRHLLNYNGRELSESDLVNVCNQVYSGGYNETQRKDFEQGLTNATIENFETDWIAGDWNDWIEDILENSNQKTEVLCGNLVDEFDDLRVQKRFIEANQLVVEVYFFELTGTRITKDSKRPFIVAHDFVYGKTGYVKKAGTIDDRLI